MRIIFAGTPKIAIPSLTALIQSEHEVIAVLTRPDARGGRGLIATPSAVAVVASENNIPILKYAHLRDKNFQQDLETLNPDAIAVVAFGAMVPTELLAQPQFGWINLHFSLLPSWRGAAPVPYSIRFGDEITGATTFQIDEGLDTGPIYGVITEQIKPDDTSGTLLIRLSISGAELLIQTLSGIARGKLVARPQISEGVSFAPKLSPTEGEIDWRQPSLAVERQIRAFSPDPGAWTTLNGVRIRLGPVSILESNLVGTPGELIVSKNEVFVTTGSTSIRLETVQAPGKREMPAADWARGIRVGSGAVFTMSNP